MFGFPPRQLRRPTAPDPGLLCTEFFRQSAATLACIRHINYLPEATKGRYLRSLVPPSLLARFGVHPVSWLDGQKRRCVEVEAAPGTNKLSLRAFAGGDSASTRDPFLEIELQDNHYHGIELNLLLLRDPLAPRFATDWDAAGRQTFFGTVHRNLAAEELARCAGLAPGQTQQGLRASTAVLQQIECFLTMLAQHTYLLEPLTYASAILFERRGFRYVRGSKQLAAIEREFQPGGALHKALDGSTPFRQPVQARSVRGRAWAIHDGILDAVGLRWDDIRMIKTVGVDARGCTSTTVPY